MPHRELVPLAIQLSPVRDKSKEQIYPHAFVFTHDGEAVLDSMLRLL